jgi:phosphoserine phosphatase
LVRGKTCVEAIAAAIGRADDCARFERLAMRDVTAVRAARETMAGWYERFSDAELTAPLSELELAPGSEAAFRLLRRHGIETAIVSITWSFAVDWFARRLGADYTLGTRLGPDGIEHVWPADKGPWLEALIERLSLERSAVAAVGDSNGDRELLEAAGVRFFVGDRPPGIPGLVHLPGGDMLEIAGRIVSPPRTAS